MESPIQTQAENSPRSMRAAAITDYRTPLEVRDVPVAAVPAGGALIRVEACGVCRSDWHFWNHDLAWLGMDLPLPTVLGHEVGGVVEEVGTGVKDVAVGDRVTIPFHEADGTCPMCRAGLQNLCDNGITPGLGRTGGWAEYVTVTAADLNCIRLPDAVSMVSAAALGCRFMTGYRAVQRTYVQPGQWLSVHGCGGVGLSSVQVGAASGALVVAVDVNDETLARAEAEGAVTTINATGMSPKEVGEAVKDATGGGAHTSIDALGHGFTFHQSFYALRKAGRHVQAGITSQAEKGMVELPLDLLTNMELEVAGSLGNPHPNYAELLALIERGVLDPARLVTREISLGEITDTLTRMTDYDTMGFEVVTQFS